VREDPESVKIQLSCQFLFKLLGSAHAKAVHRTLVKLTPVVFVYNHSFITFSIVNLEIRQPTDIGITICKTKYCFFKVIIFL